MKFSIDRDAFSKLLKRIDGVCGANGTFTVLTNCVLQAEGDTLTATGTDLAVTICSNTKANIIEEGRCIVLEKKLSDTIATLDSGKEIIFSTDSNSALIECGSYKSRIPKLADATDYPKLDLFDARSSVKIAAPVLKMLIDKIYFSISTDDTRPDFTGAHISVSENGSMQLVSTDGHRLSRVEGDAAISGPISDNLLQGVIVPRKALNELNRMLTAGDIVIDYAQNKFVAQSDEFVFYTNPINGQFPDFSKVIPAVLDHKAVIRREDFAKMLQRAAIYSSKLNTIRLTLAPGRLSVSSYDGNNAEMTDCADVEYDGAGVTAGFNWRFILDILKSIACDIVSMEISDEDSPAVIRDVTTNKLDYIVMPMQL